MKSLHDRGTFKVNGQRLKLYYGGTFNAHEEVARFTDVPIDPVRRRKDRLEVLKNKRLWGGNPIFSLLEEH